MGSIRPTQSKCKLTFFLIICVLFDRNITTMTSRMKNGCQRLQFNSYTHSSSDASIEWAVVVVETSKSKINSLIFHFSSRVNAFWISIWESKKWRLSKALKNKRHRRSCSLWPVKTSIRDSFTRVENRIYYCRWTKNKTTVQTKI
jgi:hypothetical protein